MKVNPQKIVEDREKEEVRNYFENKQCGIFVDVGGNEPVFSVFKGYASHETIYLVAFLREELCRG